MGQGGCSGVWWWCWWCVRHAVKLCCQRPHNYQTENNNAGNELNKSKLFRGFNGGVELKKRETNTGSKMREIDVVSATDLLTLWKTKSVE